MPEERPREEFTVLHLVEPGALDIEEPEARNPPDQCEGIDGRLGDWLDGRRIGLVVQDVHGTVSDLQKVDVPGDNTWRVPDVALERQHGIELIRRDRALAVSMRAPVAR